MCPIGKADKAGEGSRGRRACLSVQSSRPDCPMMSSGNATSFTTLRPHESALSSESPTQVMSGGRTRTAHVAGECEMERSEWCLSGRSLGSVPLVCFGSASASSTTRSVRSREREPELLDVPLVLLRERVKTIPASASKLFRPEPFRQWTSKGFIDPSLKPTAGDSKGDINAETCAVRFVGSER